MSGDLWRNVGSCQRGRGLEWFRLVSPSPPRIGAQLKDSAVFFDRQSRTQRFNDLARGDQKHWEGPRVLSIWLIPRGPLSVADVHMNTFVPRLLNMLYVGKVPG